MPVDYKLVRDKIPQRMEQDGEQVSMYIATDEEFGPMLDKKLREECEEAISAPHSVEELADILEVLHARAKRAGISMADVENFRQKKFQEKGGFERRQVVKFDK